MIAATVGLMAAGDPQRYAEIASLTALVVAGLCLLAWVFRLSVLVLLISDSVLVGFKIGAGLTIAMTQLPSLMGVPGGGHSFLERVLILAGQLTDIKISVFAIGMIALMLLFQGERAFPGRPVALAVVALAIIAATLFQLPAIGVPVTGYIPSGLPALSGPALRPSDIEGIVPLAAGCLLLAYVEGISAARSFASKHGYSIDARQEFLGLGAANLAAALGQGYPVAGGLSQSAVNDKAGARSQVALVFASVALALCLLFLTGLLENLPKAVLAAIVLMAIIGLFDFPKLGHMWRVSNLDFYAAIIALAAVLLLGILQGIVLAAFCSILLLLFRASRPHVAFLGRIPGTQNYSDMARHPENEQLARVLAFRPEASLIYVNADAVMAAVRARLDSLGVGNVRLVVCDLSASPFIDLAGSQALSSLAAKLAILGIPLRIVGAHGYVRDFLRADGLSDKVAGIDRELTLSRLLDGLDEPPL
jgi:MFS superfamily sulfate permease-like transporter